LTLNHDKQSAEPFGSFQGATPMLGMLREMAAKRLAAGQEVKEAGEGGFPSKVMIHWSCRGGAEFALLDEDLIDIHM
jgi:hypothetical protein